MANVLFAIAKMENDAERKMQEVLFRNASAKDLSFAINIETLFLSYIILHRGSF